MLQLELERFEKLENPGVQRLANVEKTRGGQGIGGIQ
jgi:hypothetical protein